MSRTLRLPSLIGIALAAAVGLAACGTSTIDVSQVESTVVEQFAAQGVPLRETSCEDVDAEVGAPVRCTALNPQDTKLFIEGKVTAINDDKGRFEVVAARGEAKGTAIAADAKALLEAKVGEKARAMTCPETVEIPTRTPVRCTLTVGDGTRLGVSVTVDAKGKASVEVDDEPVS
ncbi:MAG: DUF4333 domain-containing protein [Patulibacter sp.]